MKVLREAKHIRKERRRSKGRKKECVNVLELARRRKEEEGKGE